VTCVTAKSTIFPVSALVTGILRVLLSHTSHRHTEWKQSGLEKNSWLPIAGQSILHFPLAALLGYEPDGRSRNRNNVGK
jgi:hypothetical protein